MLRFPRRSTLFLVLLLLAVPSAVHAATFPASRPSTTNNDDSCDIAVLPAATLLLPHFEVDVASAATARTTLFTVINTVKEPQIARVTIWTDLSWPVLTFDVFLTGYDAQAFNLYDVVVRGVIGSPSSDALRGSRSLSTNPNFLAGASAACANLPQLIPSPLLADVMSALTTGVAPGCGQARVGSQHAAAAGYVTVDLVGTCSGKSPHDAGYFDQLLFDNVLTGEYRVIAPSPATGNYAGGNAMVHIRAMPEGGAAGSRVAAALPYTFYDRYTPGTSRTVDRRQPLPATFVARFIESPGGFQTTLDIWREGLTRSGSLCSVYQSNDMIYAHVVRFDERENAAGHAPSLGIPQAPTADLNINASERIDTRFRTFPPMSSPLSGVAGWMYLNLNNGGSDNYSSQRNLATRSSTIVGPRPSQNWVTVNMFAEGRYSTTADATMLGNGCNPAPPVMGMRSDDTVTIPPIGPGPNDAP